MSKSYEKNLKILFSIYVILIFLQPTFNVQAQPVGVKRGDIFIVSNDHVGRVVNPTDHNVWRPGSQMGMPIGCCLEVLFTGNFTSQSFIPILATGYEYSSDFKTLRIFCRQGVYWNDGVEFTAEDVAYTIMLLKNVTGFGASSYMNTWVEKAYAETKYTVVVELKGPNPKFHAFSSTWGGITGTYIMPKHIFENVANPLEYKFFPPVGTGPYVLRDYDPSGYWFLWERREDWYRSGAGKVVGKPKPKYLLQIFYENDEAEVAAMIRHELDWTQISYQLLNPLVEGNPYARSFWKGPPYAWLNGVCAFATVFNCEKHPYSLTDVRWALALAINITEVSMTAFNCMTRLAYMMSLSTSYLAPIFEPKVIPFYEEFSLSDGYKPWDPTVPYKLANAAKLIYNEEVPGDPAKIYGPGWWKYDPDEASKLLQGQGFYRDDGGNWHLPNGDLWEINIVSAAELQHKTNAFAIAEQWTKFGIKTKVDTPTGAVFNQRYQLGDYDVASVNPLCTVMPDTTQQWSTLNKRWYKPIGEIATGNQFRWVNDEVSSLLNEMETLPFNDPKCVDLSINILKAFTKEMPMINLFHGSKLICCDNYVWQNIPVGENNYAEAHWWSGNWITVLVLPFIENTGNAPSDEYQKETPGTTPISAENLTEVLNNLQSSIQSLNSKTTDVSNQIANLTSQMNNLMYIAVVQAIILIVVLIILFLRKK